MIAEVIAPLRRVPGLGRIRSVVSLVNRRNIRTVLRYVRHGQFKALRRHIACAVLSNAPVDDLLPLAIPDSSQGKMRQLHQSTMGDFIRRALAKAAIRSFRMMYAAAHLAESKTVLIVDHALGGGANLYRAQLLQQYAAQGHPILLLRYEYHAQKMRLCFTFREYKADFILESLDDLIQLSRLIPLEEIFYNNLVSYPDPLAAATALPLIKEAVGVKLTVTFHDFFPICPSYTLINSAGRYCEIPSDVDVCELCLSESKLEFVGKPDGGIARWRQIWGALISSADTVLCFSEDTARLVQKAYPLAGAKITVRPHRVDYLPPRLPQVDLDANLHIGVVGDISYAKGAAVVQRIAELIDGRELRARITIVGKMRYDKKLPPSIRVTGPYERENLAEIIERERINICFLPSIWPETFSYVTEELMRLKMPLCCFDLGAPADRVRTYPMGRVLSSINEPDAALDEIIGFYEGLRCSKRNKELIELSIPYSDRR